MANAPTIEQKRFAFIPTIRSLVHELCDVHSKASSRASSSERALAGTPSLRSAHSQPICARSPHSSVRPRLGHSCDKHELARYGIVPVAEGTDRDRPAHCRTLPGGPTPTLAGSEPQRRKEAIDGGRTDRNQLCSQARVVADPAVSAGRRAGITTFRRLAQTRSDASQSAPRASRTAGPYRTLGRRSGGGTGGLDNKRMQCLR